MAGRGVEARLAAVESFLLGLQVLRCGGESVEVFLDSGSRENCSWQRWKWCLAHLLLKARVIESQSEEGRREGPGLRWSRGDPGLLISWVTGKSVVIGS